MINSWRWLLVAVVLFAGLFLALGCGDDNGDGNGDEPEATEPANGEATEEPSDGNGDEGISSLLEEYGEQEFKITYELSGTDMNAGTMTFYWKPDTGWRVDFSEEGGEESILINAGDASYICTPENGGGQCITSPIAGGAVPVPFFNLFTDPAELETLFSDIAGIDLDESSREIAGVDATCFSGAGEVEGVAGEAEFCFGDGFMLYFSASDDAGDITMEATSVETSVADSDLEPPYDVQEIPGLDDIPESP